MYIRLNYLVVSVCIPSTSVTHNSTNKQNIKEPPILPGEGSLLTEFC